MSFPSCGWRKFGKTAADSMTSGLVGCSCLMLHQQRGSISCGLCACKVTQCPRCLHQSLGESDEQSISWFGGPMNASILCGTPSPSVLSSEMAVQLHVMLAACAFLLISAVFSAICWVVLRALKLQCAFSQGGHMGLVKQEYK